MRKILHSKSGETIVEILVSFLMLLIFISAFATAIRAANRMMTKANQIREDAYQVTLQMYPLGSITPAGTVSSTTSQETLTFTCSGLPLTMDVVVKTTEVTATIEKGDQTRTATHTFVEYTNP